MREHIFAVHKSGYRCHNCGKSFCRKALLRRHEAGHEGCFGSVAKTTAENSPVKESYKSVFESESSEKKLFDRHIESRTDKDKAMFLEKAVIQNEAFVIQKVPNVNYVQKDEAGANQSLKEKTSKQSSSFEKSSDNHSMCSQTNKSDPPYNLDLVNLQLNQYKLMEFYRRLHFNRLCYDSIFYSDYFKAFTNVSEFKKSTEKHQGSLLNIESIDNSFFQNSFSNFQLQHFLSLNECFINLQKKFLHNESTSQSSFLQQNKAEDHKNYQMKPSK